MLLFLICCLLLYSTCTSLDPNRNLLYEPNPSSWSISTTTDESYSKYELPPNLHTEYADVCTLPKEYSRLTAYTRSRSHLRDGVVFVADGSCEAEGETKTSSRNLLGKLSRHIFETNSSNAEMYIPVLNTISFPSPQPAHCVLSYQGFLSGVEFFNALPVYLLQSSTNPTSEFVVTLPCPTSWGEPYRAYQNAFRVPVEVITASSLATPITKPSQTTLSPRRRYLSLGLYMYSNDALDVFRSIQHTHTAVHIGGFRTRITDSATSMSVLEHYLVRALRPDPTFDDNDAPECLTPGSADKTSAMAGWVYADRLALHMNPDDDDGTCFRISYAAPVFDALYTYNSQLPVIDLLTNANSVMFFTADIHTSRFARHAFMISVHASDRAGLEIFHYRYTHSLHKIYNNAHTCINLSSDSTRLIQCRIAHAFDVQNLKKNTIVNKLTLFIRFEYSKSSEHKGTEKFEHPLELSNVHFFLLHPNNNNNSDKQAGTEPSRIQSVKALTASQHTASAWSQLRNVWTTPHPAPAAPPHTPAPSTRPQKHQVEPPLTTYTPDVSLSSLMADVVYMDWMSSQQVAIGDALRGLGADLDVALGEWKREMLRYGTDALVALEHEVTRAVYDDLMSELLSLLGRADALRHTLHTARDVHADDSSIIMNPSSTDAREGMMHLLMEQLLGCPHGGELPLLLASLCIISIVCILTLFGLAVSIFE